MISPLIIFLLAALVSETVGTFTGFGATMILLPIATFLMPLKDAIVIVGVFHLFGTAFRTLFFARKVNFRIALLFGIPSLIMSFIGGSLLANVDASILTKIVGVALIIYAFYSLFKEKVKLPRSSALLVSGGGIVGFVAGIIGTAGAMRGAFLTSWSLSPEVYLGTGALMGLGADASRVVAYWNSGLLTGLTGELFILLILVALLGTVLGKILVTRTKEKTFGKVVFAALLLAGLRLLFL